MPNPAGLNTTTLHMKYVEPNATATPLQGTLTFTPSPSPILFPAENVIVAGTETVTLDVNGEATIELISTDQAGENPTGWLYTVTEKIIGQKQRTFNIALPYTGGALVELADISPTDAAPNYIPVVGPAGPPGAISSVNGYTTSAVNLTAADVNAIPTSQLGAANGVATLDAGQLVPLAQIPVLTIAKIPDLSATYVPQTAVGVANGIATLDGSSKVKTAQLSLATATPPSVGTGAVGTSTNLAREDHTHAGVDLVNAQTIAGAKNFTTSVRTAQLGVGVAPGGARVNVQSTVDEIVALLQQTATAPANPVLRIITAASTDTALGIRAAADSSPRLSILTSGALSWGPGNAATDTTLSRSGANELTASGQLVITTAAPTAAGHATRKDYVDTNFTTLTTAQTISGVKTYTAAPILQGSGAGSTVLKFQVSGDANPRLAIGADGTMSFGPGTTAADLVVSRSGSAALAVNNTVRVTMAASTSVGFATIVTADTFDRYRTYLDGKQEWGPGNAARDANLYRAGVGLLQTDQNFKVAGQLTIGTFGIYVISDWATLASVGTFQNGAAAGAVTPKVRKVMYFGTEVWELQGQINLGAWTGSTIFSFTNGATSGYAPTSEHDFPMVFGPGATSTIGTMRMYWNGSANIGISPTPAAGTWTTIFLDQIRINNPLNA